MNRLINSKSSCLVIPLIGRTAPFSDLIDHELAPGNAVDDGEALRANIVATVDAYEHPTSLRHFNPQELSISNEGLQITSVAAPENPPRAQ